MESIYTKMKTDPNYTKAVSKYVRITPRKARYAADLIRGLPLDKARQQLAFAKIRGGRLLEKTLNSAVANACNKNPNVREENMKVALVLIDPAPSLKRARPRSKGSSHPILKRASHFTVVISTEVK
jgi:large subunit ribosomal protein L22